MSKLRASTFCCAFSSALLIQGWMIASSSLRPSFCSMPSMRSDPKMRIRSSCSDRKKLRVAGVALAAGTAAQLVVDAAALVALGADDVEAAGGERLLLEAGDLGADLAAPARRAPGPAGIVGELVADAHVGVAAELDVGAAAGHVGGDGDGAGHAGLGDDEGLLLVVAGVQDGEVLFRGVAVAEQLGQVGGVGEIALAPALASGAAPRAAPTSRSRWCRPGPAGRASWQSLDERRRSPCTSRRPSGRPRRRRPCATIGRLVGTSTTSSL